MKTVINIEDSSLEEILAKTPEILMKELEEGNPNIQVLATIPTPKENLFGFQYQKTTPEENYTKLFQHQQKIIDLANKAKNTFGITPFAIIPKALVEQAVIKTHGLYMWQNLNSDGTFTVPSEPVGNYLKKLYELKELYLDIIQYDTFGKWLDERSRRNYSSGSNLEYYLGNYKEQKGKLQRDLQNKQIYGLSGTDIRSLFLFNLVPDSTFVEELITNITSTGSKFLRWLDFSRDNSFEIKKIRREIDGLESARKITRAEIEVRHRAFVSDFLQSLFNTKEHSGYRIFSESKSYGSKVAVQFVDPPVDFFVILQQMKGKGIQPIIIAEHDAVRFNLDEILAKPLVVYDFCPVVGYLLEGHMVFLKRYGNFSVEEKFKRSVTELYVAHFLGEEYTN